MGETQRGYTLLETMLVCGLLAMLAAAALPFWLPRRDQQRMLAEGQRLQTYLLTLREQAFRSNGVRPILFRRGRGARPVWLCSRRTTVAPPRPLCRSRRCAWRRRCLQTPGFTAYAIRRARGTSA
ncbi:prepilin-type N-terminal cleavage/methylation domain-containing protein [Edwardsiella piscicida]|nr:prepilin-type N-terminal cleavage/methylation domain-containing protein [Edwardsiella piscicida]